MAKGPEPIREILAQLMARRGFARVRSAETFDAAWRKAVGEMFSQFTRPGSVRRGKLEVTVANSTVVQVLSFHKSQWLKSLADLLPPVDQYNIRFRVGPVK